jgi:hypothetical protein
VAHQAAVRNRHIFSHLRALPSRYDPLDLAYKWWNRAYFSAANKLKSKTDCLNRTILLTVHDALEMLMPNPRGQT